MKLTLEAPQLIMLGLMVLGLVFTATVHGRPKTGKHDVWVLLVSTGIQIWLMWWGGFFGQD